jgi:cyclopropane-fatty-acyl-phospholipid synthase
VVRDPRFFRAVALGGSTGAGEAYVEGWWECDDLVSLIRIFALNRGALSSLDSGFSRISEPLYRLGRWIRRNTLAGARRNIASHYDLSNDFFALWLDRSMMYSAAMFAEPTMTLAQAQQSKIARICRKLELSPRDHLVEIGSGWGALAMYAAEHHGCRVTTTTISTAQAALTRTRVRERGLDSLVNVVEHDYRQMVPLYGEASFTKLVSIEMIEAVGAEYLDEYFECCSRLVTPDGRMLIQAILMSDADYPQSVHSPDFIQKHIFPGSFIPSLGAICKSSAGSTDLMLSHVEEFGTHYARTLRDWREAFESNLHRVYSMGFDERFVRMWRFYLCYCEGAFAQRHISVAQILFRKPRDHASLFPMPEAVRPE